MHPTYTQLLTDKKDVDIVKIAIRFEISYTMIESYWVSNFAKVESPRLKRLYLSKGNLIFPMNMSEQKFLFLAWKYSKTW